MNVNQIKRSLAMTFAGLCLFVATVSLVLGWSVFWQLPVSATPKEVLSGIYLYGLCLSVCLWLFLKAMARVHIYNERMREDIITHLPYLFDRV